MIKKKKFFELDRVTKFFSLQSEAINEEYNVIVSILEKDGKLNAPFGEKVNKKLFAIRVISSGNVRVFYVYGINDYIYSVHAYVKKSREIPKKELDIAIKIVKELNKTKLI